MLVVEHSADGALGLVLNRPSGTTVLDAVPQLAQLVGDGEQEVLVGGPVAQSAVIVLADFEDPDDAALIAFDHVGVLGGDSAAASGLDAEEAREEVGDPVDEAVDEPAGASARASYEPEAGGGEPAFGADEPETGGDQDPPAAAFRHGGTGFGLRRTRVFAGHSGWGPGQLDGELARGDWILEPARYSDAFARQPDALWSSVLERKGGSYALVARMPPDPSLN